MKLVTELGRGYHVRCRYKSREAAAAPKQIASNEGTPDALVADNPDRNAMAPVDRREHGRSLGGGSSGLVDTNKIPLPGCHMRIYKTDKEGNSKIADNVVIGDMLMLEISIDKQDVYGMHVVDCNVHDGLGWGEQKLFKLG